MEGLRLRVVWIKFALFVQQIEELIRIAGFVFFQKVFVNIDIKRFLLFNNRKHQRRQDLSYQMDWVMMRALLFSHGIVELKNLNMFPFLNVNNALFAAKKIDIQPK